MNNEKTYKPEGVMITKEGMLSYNPPKCSCDRYEICNSCNPDLFKKLTSFKTLVDVEEHQKILNHEVMMQRKLKETLKRDTEENYYTKKFLIEDANKKIELIDNEKKTISNILDRINEIKKEEDNLLNNLEIIIKGEIKWEQL